MIIQSLIEFGKTQLKDNSPTPLLDARVLISHFLQCSFTDLILQENNEVADEVEKLFKAAIEKRKQYYPIAYIIGKKEFFGREFEVNENVLIPRPETEELIEQVLKITNYELRITNKILPITILDLGTGSGCIAITLKKEMPELEVFAGDISEIALEVAKRNAKKHGADIHFFQTDLLKNLPSEFLSPPPRGLSSEFSIIIANLPYVSDSARDPSTLREPETALFSGADGLDHYRHLAAEMEDFQKTHGFPVCEILILEIDDAQADKIPSIFPDTENIKILKDIGGKRRIAILNT